jgi:hypothetical protein
MAVTAGEIGERAEGLGILGRLAATRRDHDHGVVVEPAGEEGYELSRGRVRPLQILQHEHHGGAPGARLEQAAHRLAEAVADRPGVERLVRDRGAALGCEVRQEVEQVRIDGARGRVGRGERPQRVDHRRIRKQTQLAEAAAGGDVCAVRLGLGERHGHEAALADARLPADEHEPAVAAPRRVEQAAQLGEDALPLDELHARTLDRRAARFQPGGYSAETARSSTAPRASSARPAASCSASFFEPPVPRPSSWPPTSAAQTKRRSCGGPSSAVTS